MPGNKRWTGDEIDILRSEYGRSSISHLSKKLGRSVDSIHWKANQLEIKYSPTTDLHLHEQLIRIERRLDGLFEIYLTRPSGRVATILATNCKAVPFCLNASVSPSCIKA